MKKLLVVNLCPTAQEQAAGAYGIGQKDALTRNVLIEVIGAPMAHVVFTVMLPDMLREQWMDLPDGERTKALRSGLKRVYEEAVNNDCSCVLAIGAAVTEGLLGQSSFDADRGRVHHLPEMVGIPIVPTYDPFAASSNDRLLKPFGEDLLKAWNIVADAPAVEVDTQVVDVRTKKQVRQLIRHVIATGECCFDFETTDADKMFQPGFAATALSISFQPGSSWIIPLDHAETPFSPAEQVEIMQLLGVEVFSNPDVRKTAHNIKYDLKVAAHLYGITELDGRLDDTMLMKHLVEPLTPNGLKGIVADLFPQFDGYDADFNKYPFGTAPWPIMAQYAAVDTDMTLRIRIHMEERLLEDPRLYRLYRNLSMSLCPILVSTEVHGMLVDKEGLLANTDRANELVEQQEAKLKNYPAVLRVQKYRLKAARSRAIERTEEALNKCKPLKDGSQGKRETMLRQKLEDLRTGKEVPDTDVEVNLGSPAQLGEILYSDMGYGHPEPYDPKKRGPGRLTGADVINRFPDEDGFIDSLLVLRSLQKTRSTYLVGILDRLDTNNYLHTEFLQHGTQTGRLSSKNPNLQNLPDPNRVKNEHAKEVSGYVKRAFVVPEGYTLVQLDFSQAELRLMAMYAQEDVMLAAYAAGEDIHSLTAANLNGMTLEEFKALPKDEMKVARYHAKAANFGLIYGMSAEGFKEYAQNSYGIVWSLEQAKANRDTFFRTYPNIPNYHEEYIAKARKFGGVRTFGGRFRPTPDILDPSEYVRSMDERVAVNTPIQGSSAEITLLTIVLAVQRMDPRVRVVNTIHDSIMLYVPDDILADTVRILKTTAPNLPLDQYFGKSLKGITMEVDVETSKVSWKDMEPYEA